MGGDKGVHPKVMRGVCGPMLYQARRVDQEFHGDVQPFEHQGSIVWEHPRQKLEVVEGPPALLPRMVAVGE
jgi:hypothetical protein